MSSPYDRPPAPQYGSGPQVYGSGPQPGQQASPGPGGVPQSGGYSAPGSYPQSGGYSAPGGYSTPGGVPGPQTYASPQPAQAGPPGSEPALVSLPGVTITQHWVITPSGAAPRAQCSLSAGERVSITRATPTWAIVLAIVGFFVLTIFSLLFLLAKEQRVTGSVDLVVRGPGMHFATSVPVGSQAALAGLRMQVAQAQGLIGH
ncbi:hypothetical protein GSY69_11440 [Brevibacterium sp. 5221]|uniref:Uncharacterized protein n=1 Tax=Brevibacterium rongguiense TaxID=2695267 RepID=A0A6N9H935_9MICO|nr:MULTISPECIES: hypothetical protein [Brevibacterium]MYM20558.1 hypothetical protein [Brevibacterium rongguiense]WAL40952.1 hypothetical protein BRM1_03560 [Brevibacterium sp. BRM-1]